jgi:carnosine synthase
VFHVESKYTSHGARLIEVNCRMGASCRAVTRATSFIDSRLRQQLTHTTRARTGGMQVRNINLLTWGVDLVEEHLLTVVGLPSRPQKAPGPLTAISEMAYNAPRTGRMKDLSFIDEWTVRTAAACAPGCPLVV